MVSEYISKEIKRMIAEIECDDAMKVLGFEGYLWACNHDGRLNDQEYKSFLDELHKKCPVKPDLHK